MLRSVDEETLKRLKVSYAKMIEWRLVPQSEAVVIDPNLPFEVKSEVNDGVFTASIQGRVDTITAPELLTRFQEARSGIKAIHLDVSRMAYISSAGLRVLLMMYKALPDKEQFEMTGVNSEVREILETTGFDYCYRFPSAASHKLSFLSRWGLLPTIAALGSSPQHPPPADVESPYKAPSYGRATFFQAWQ